MVVENNTSAQTLALTQPSVWFMDERRIAALTGPSAKGS